MPVTTRPGPGTRSIAAAPIPFLLVLVLGGAMAGCSGDHPERAADGATAGAAAASSHTPEAHATMTADPRLGTGGMGVGATGDLPTAEEVTAGWAVRPDFVSNAAGRTQTAYAFALARPDILRWLPCYCGCGAMGHANNLDCFFKPTEGVAVVFEEHASYCDVCVDIALTAQDMLGEGRTLVQMRAAVDSTFGGLAPGTPTELPPT